MKKVVQANGKKETYFNSYKIGDVNACPECGRPFKQNNIEALEANGYIRCPKCNAKLARK